MRRGRRRRKQQNPPKKRGGEKGKGRAHTTQHARTQTNKTIRQRELCGIKKWQQQESQRHKSRVRSLGSRSVDASTLIRSRLSLSSLIPILYWR
jgi:hypothetical protein